MTFEDRTKVWIIKVARFTRYEQALKRVLVSFFTQQEKHVLSRLREVIGKKKQLMEDFPINLNYWSGLLSQKAEKVLHDALQEAARVYDSRFDATTPVARAALGERLKKFSHDVNETTKKKIIKELREGFANNEPLPMITERVQKVFKSAKKSRAALIARTEAFGASNLGTQLGLVSGKWPRKMWISSRDDRVRHSHQIDGQVVNVDEEFILADGRRMLFPSDFNERCVMIGTVEPLTEKPGTVAEEQLAPDVNPDVDFLEFKPNQVKRMDEFLRIMEDELGIDDALSNSELRVLNRYSEDLYYGVNTALRDPEKFIEKFGSRVDKVEEVKDAIPKLFNVFDKVGDFGENVIVYRGIDQYNDFGEKLIKLLNEDRAYGLVFEDQGFVSTSLNQNIPKDFGDIIFRIRLRENNKAVPLYTYSEHMAEKEVVLAPGSKFKVVNYEKKRGYWYVDVEIVEQNIDKAKKTYDSLVERLQ